MTLASPSSSCYPAEAKRLLAAMQCPAAAKPTRPDLQSRYEKVWQDNGIWQPFSLFRHLVRIIWAEHDQKEDVKASADAKRWALWARFASRMHTPATPAKVTSLKAFFYEQRNLPRAEALLVFKALQSRHMHLQQDFPCDTQLLQHWLTTDRAAHVGEEIAWEGQIFLRIGAHSIGEAAGSQDVTVTHDAVSSDSIASILARARGATRLCGATTYPDGRVHREHNSALSLAEAGIRAGMMLCILLRLHGGGPKETIPPSAPSPSPSPSAQPAQAGLMRPSPPPPAGGGGSAIDWTARRPPGRERSMVDDTSTAPARWSGVQDNNSTVTHVWKAGDFGTHVDNVTYFAGLPQQLDSQLASAKDLLIEWTYFTSNLDLTSLKAACKTR